MSVRKALDRIEEIAVWLERYSDNGQHRPINGPNAGNAFDAAQDLRQALATIAEESDGLRMRYRDATDAIDAAHELSGTLAERITLLIQQRDEARDAARLARGDGNG